jgi:Trk K+ transport system NAD-binding subunit
MRTLLILVLIGTGLVLVTGVVVFHVSLELTWIESIYFVVATMTTVGYGDYNLQHASPVLQIFGSGMMIAGAASMAATFGIITDFLLRSRLQEFLTPRRRHMRNHVVLCGLGNVGFRVLEHLHRLGETVVVVEKHAESAFVDQAKAMKVPVVIGDVRFSSVLKDVNIEEAKCLIAATDDDLANLDAALSAREVRNDMRVVLRMFDQELAKKIRDAFNIQTAFSTSALAAPAFAMAAVDPCVIGSFYIEKDLMLNLQITVAQGTQLDEMTTGELDDGNASVLAHTDGDSGQRRLHPQGDVTIRAGDTIVVALTPDCMERLKQMNASAA